MLHLDMLINLPPVQSITGSRTQVHYLNTCMICGPMVAMECDVLNDSYLPSKCIQKNSIANHALNFHCFFFFFFLGENSLSL